MAYANNIWYGYLKHPNHTLGNCQVLQQLLQYNIPPDKQNYIPAPLSQLAR